MASEQTPSGCDAGQHHVFCTLVGFGLRVIPRAPFRVRLAPGGRPPALEVEHDGPAGTASARVLPDDRGGHACEPSEAAHVLDVEPGPAADDAWLVDAPFVRFPLPADFCLHSVPADSPSPFDLVGPDDALIYAQAPRRLPPLERMFGPGQRAVARGATWIELEYEHDGRPWWQRHELFGDGVVFTAQAPAERADPTRAALAGLLAGAAP